MKDFFILLLSLKESCSSISSTTLGVAVAVSAINYKSLFKVLKVEIFLYSGLKLLSDHDDMQWLSSIAKQHRLSLLDNFLIKSWQFNKYSCVM